MADLSRKYERMPVLGVFPPEPARNIKTDNFDQAVYVPSVRTREIPISLQFGDGVNVRRENSFISQESGQLEVPYVVSGRDPNAVRARVQAVFRL